MHQIGPASHPTPSHCCSQDRPTRTAKIASCTGVYWHSGKLGWVVREGTGGVYYSEAAARQAAASRKRTTAKVASVRIRQMKTRRDVASTRSRFWNVVYHKAKKVAAYCRGTCTSHEHPAITPRG